MGSFVWTNWTGVANGSDVTSRRPSAATVAVTTEALDNFTGGGNGDSHPVGSGVSSYVKALMYIMYSTITVAAIGGNGSVCYIVLAFRNMRSVTNYFLLNLAVGDLMMAVLCIPFSFVSNLVLMYWPFGALMCPVVTYAQAVTVFISAYTMVAISIDRYIAIIYPLKPRMTKLQAKVCIFVVWMVALFTPLPTAFKSRLHRPSIWQSKEHYICTEVWETMHEGHVYSWVLACLQYLLPLSVLLFTYVRIALVVWGTKAPGEAEDSRDQRLAASKRKMVKMMILVVAIFTLCWLPFNALTMIGYLDDSIWLLPGTVYLWFALHWLAMSHACANPIIYCGMNARFRDGFRRVFRLLFSSYATGDGGSGGGRRKHSLRTYDDDGGGGGLRRCNTYSTSYTSVRTTSIVRAHGHLRNQQQLGTNRHLSDATTTTAMAVAEQNDDDDDETSQHVKGTSGGFRDLHDRARQNDRGETLMLCETADSRARDQDMSAYDEEPTSETTI